MHFTIRALTQSTSFPYHKDTCKQFLRTLQALVEGLLSEYPNTLILRVRMPIVADMTYPRNFITKIIKYDKVRQSSAAPIRSETIWSDCSNK